MDFNINGNVGIDIIETGRFRKKPFEQNQSFYNSIFTNEEIQYCLNFSDSYTHFAGTFAAKEAIKKCIKNILPLNSIEITRQKNGKPIINIKGKILSDINISISHTDKIAIAIALIISSTLKN